MYIRFIEFRPSEGTFIHKGMGLALMVKAVSRKTLHFGRLTWYKIVNT
jgi:hypothetical protein